MTTENRLENGQAEHLPAPMPQRREVRVVHDEGPLAFLLDTARFEHVQRIAMILADGSFTPKHLRGATAKETLANCVRVTLQALRWNMDPFAVGDETYVVHGRLGYQGKLIIALINSRANLKGRLNFAYTGKGDDRTVTVSGTFRDEEEARFITLSVKQAKTDNKIWVADPDQKLAYSGATKWARRHCPEVIQGVMTDDDVDRIIEQEPAPTLPVGRVSLRKTTPTVEVEAEKAPSAEPTVVADPPTKTPATVNEDTDKPATEETPALPANVRAVIEEIHAAPTRLALLAIGDKIEAACAAATETEIHHWRQAVVEFFAALAKAATNVTVGHLERTYHHFKKHLNGHEKVVLRLIDDARTKCK